MSQFLRFCAVGGVGFVIDAGILQTLVSLASANPYLARIVSFLCAASATWILNRRYTFGVSRRPSQPEWVRYVVFTGVGAGVNYGVFAFCLAASELIRAQPWLGVAVGSVAGLGINFLTSRRLVFRDV